MDIFKATEQGNLEIFTDLAEEGADLLGVNKHGKPIIFIAIERNRLEIIDFLLKSDSEGKQLELIYKDDTPVKYALKHDRCNIVVKFFNHDPLLSAKKDQWGDTLLTSAIYNKENEHLKCLVPISDLDATDKYGNSPLMKAIWEANVKAMYELFSKGGVDKNEASLKHGDTSLTQALYMQDTNPANGEIVLAFLFKVCVDPFALNARDESPREVAKKLDSRDIENRLLAYIESNDCAGDYDKLPGSDLVFGDNG